MNTDTPIPEEVVDEFEAEVRAAKMAFIGQFHTSPEFIYIEVEKINRFKSAAKKVGRCRYADFVQGRSDVVEGLVVMTVLGMPGGWCRCGV